MLFQGGYGAAGGSQATVGTGGCGSGGEKIIFDILSLDHIEQFFEHAKSKDYHLGFAS